jgi:hypothetical protein
MISDWIIKTSIGLVFKKLDGYRTTIGAIGSILCGIVGLIGHFYPDSGLTDMDVEVALGFIIFGWGGLWGIGGKLEKGNKIAKASQVESKVQAEQVTETLQAVADKECT